MSEKFEATDEGVRSKDLVRDSISPYRQRRLNLGS